MDANEPPLILRKTACDTTLVECAIARVANPHNKHAEHKILCACLHLPIGI